MPEPETGETRVLDAADLDALIAALHGAGYDVIGPAVRDGAIDYRKIDSTADLPAGWRDAQEAGHYRLTQRDDGAYFGFSNGPGSWKRHLHPPRTLLWEAALGGGEPVFSDATEAPERPMAFFGVRACDLAAIGMLDRVLADDSHYQARRQGTAIIAVNCGQAGATCFCASMETGPAVSRGFDLALTELMKDEEHIFLVETGSALGNRLLDGLPTREATSRHSERASEAIARAASQMGRTLETQGLKEAIGAAAESPHWEEVAGRCLTCGNCTMVCPTCYCTEMEDVADLEGTHAERWRLWESCFTLDFSYAMGGSVRQSAASRYRQWLTHKLSTWDDQFGSLGCVGCGRCITWCPVGIDITAEATALRGKGEVRW